MTVCFALMNDSYVDDDLRASESDLLYAVEQRPGVAEPGDEPRSLRLYLLFEHQSRAGSVDAIPAAEVLLPHLG